MSVAQAAMDCGVWSVEGQSIRIEYSIILIESLRAAAVEGFNRVRHGGVEVGGVLFGVRENEGVRILHFRPLPIEYATGPHFALSPKDREALTSLLESAREDAELAGTVCCGWYHSHTRSGISLSESDLETYNRFFPELWHVALVLRPSNSDPVRAGFFFREESGTVQSQFSYREFTLPGPRPQGAVAWLPDEPPNAPSASGDSSERDLAFPASRARWLQPIASVPGAWEQAALAKESRWKRYAWGVLALLVLALGVVAWTTWPGRRASGVALAASESDGLLHIQWDRNAAALRSAQRAVIEIGEGGDQIQLPLNGEQLRKGSITYARQTDDVTIYLKIDRSAGEPIEELTRFVAPLNRRDKGKTADPEADRRKAELEREAASMRATLQQQNEQLVKMTQALNAMKTGEVQKAAAEARKPALVPKQITPPPAPQSARILAYQPPPQQRLRQENEPAPLLPPPVSAPLAGSDTPSILGSTSAALPSIAPPPSARITAPVAETVKVAPPQPSSGQLIWTGRLGKDGKLTIEGNHPSTGSMTGALPGLPLRVRVYPADLTSSGIVLYTAAGSASKKAAEPASAKNGWNRTVYTKDEKRAGSVRVVEVPGPENNWKKLVLRGDPAKLSMVVMEWSATK